MNESEHHIRLLAGLEIPPGQPGGRVLDRRQAEGLAGELAGDLQRVVAAVDEGLLVLGAAVFEPFELMRPGFPAWRALEELSRSARRDSGFEPGILAIGAHGGRMPDARLQPPSSAPQGQFLALPMVLVCTPEKAEGLRAALEEALFERGSIDPPARARLDGALGLETVHGQLLTLADLIALQHVQLDGAGLGGFWPVVERVLVDPDEDHELDLPAGLEARWNPSARRVDLPFLTLDQFSGEVEDYVLWLRALRTLTALLDTHGIEWRTHPRDSVVFDADYGSMIETRGESRHPNGVTVHHHPDIGLLAWTVVEDGRMMHIYPLRPDAANRVMSDLAARGLPRFDATQQLHVQPETGRLRPAEQ